MHPGWSSKILHILHILMRSAASLCAVHLERRYLSPFTVVRRQGWRISAVSYVSIDLKQCCSWESLGMECQVTEDSLESSKGSTFRWFVLAYLGPTNFPRADSICPSKSERVARDPWYLFAQFNPTALKASPLSSSPITSRRKIRLEFVQSLGDL